MKYQERTGVGYRVDREDGTYSYQYFEPIPSSQRHFQTIKGTKGGNLLTGHGISSDQRHADPFLGGGTSNINYSRIQRENAHPTGTPKFCGNSGAACETFSLNRGNDFTHAPARQSAINGAQTRDFHPDFCDVTALPACRHDDQGEAGCGHYVPLQEKGPPDLNQSFYGEIRGGYEKMGSPGAKSFVARGEPVKSGRGPTFSKTSSTPGSRQDDDRPQLMSPIPHRRTTQDTEALASRSPIQNIVDTVTESHVDRDW